MNQGCVLGPVDNGLDERATVGPLVEYGDDDSLVGHDDLESAHVAISEWNGGRDLRTGPAWLLG